MGEVAPWVEDLLSHLCQTLTWEAMSDRCHHVVVLMISMKRKSHELELRKGQSVEQSMKKGLL